MSYAQEVAVAMPTKRQMTRQEKEWQAQDDAHTLANAEVVKNDPTRLSAAKSAALKIADEEKDRAEAMGHVSKIRKSKTLEGSGEQGEDKPKAKQKQKAKPKNVHNVFNRL